MCKGLTTEEFASGKACYLFNDSSSVSTAESPLAWYQAIGRDAYPTFEANPYCIVKYASEGYYNDIENLASFTLQDGDDYEAALNRTVTSLTYTRTFADNDFDCLYVPFKARVSDFTDCSIYAINMFQQTDTDNDGQVDDVKLEVIKAPQDASIKPNHPYLIKYNGLQTGIEQTFTFANADLSPAATPAYKCASMNADFVFNGQYSTSTPSAAEYYTLVYDEAKGKVMLATTTEAIGTQRWYMTMTARESQFDNDTKYSGSLRSISIVVAGEEDEVTGIANTRLNSASNGKSIENGQLVVVRNGRKYTLNGQLLK